jgi:hypothetical protein
MRKWFLPLTVLGLGGVGALVLSERGRKAIIWAMERLDEAPERFSEWNENAQSELERIQINLNRLAESLDTARPSVQS